MTGQTGGGEIYYATATGGTAITNVVAISAKGPGACAVLATGAVRCWGHVLAANTTPTPISAFEA
jgi:hypothetical protein